MLGDKAPIREIAEIKAHHGACLFVDEAHSLGVLGEQGRGLAEEAGVLHEVDFIVGTFSKSLGTTGGFCVSRHAELALFPLCKPSLHVHRVTVARGGRMHPVGPARLALAA